MKRNCIAANSCNENESAGKMQNQELYRESSLIFFLLHTNQKIYMLRTFTLRFWRHLQNGTYAFCTIQVIQNGLSVSHVAMDIFMHLCTAHLGIPSSRTRFYLHKKTSNDCNEQ